VATQGYRRNGPEGSWTAVQEDWICFRAAAGAIHAQPAVTRVRDNQLFAGPDRDIVQAELSPSFGTALCRKSRIRDILKAKSQLLVSDITEFEILFRLSKLISIRLIDRATGHLPPLFGFSAANPTARVAARRRAHGASLFGRTA
jgi:hypothetical protein